MKADDLLACTSGRSSIKNNKVLMKKNIILTILFIICLLSCEEETPTSNRESKKVYIHAQKGDRKYIGD